MARFKLAPSVSFEVHMILTEEQARALCELGSYKAEDTVKRIVGESSVLAESSKGLTSFIKDCKENIEPQLSKIDASRKALNE